MITTLEHADRHFYISWAAGKIRRFIRDLPDALIVAIALVLIAGVFWGIIRFVFVGILVGRQETAVQESSEGNDREGTRQGKGVEGKNEIRRRGEMKGQKRSE